MKQERIFYILKVCYINVGVKVPPKGKPFNYKALLEEVPGIGRLIQLEFLRMAMELAYRDRVI